MSGPGTLVINGINSYSGPTTLNGGTVSGTGSLQGSVTANAGATIAPGTTVTPATFTLGSSLTLNGATNLIKLSSDPTQAGNGVNDLISVNGNVILQNISRIKIVPLGPLSTSSPYTVLQYSGAQLTSADAAHLQVISDSPRYSFTVVDPATTQGTIQVSVTGNAANLRWNGGVTANPTAWDHTTTNWVNTGTSALDSFFSGDAVLFNDISATNLVTIVGTETPTTTTMSNNAVAYTFAGGTLGGVLDMEGAVPLTLAMTNAPSLLAITNNSGALIFNLTNLASYPITAIVTDSGGAQGAVVKTGTNTMVLQGDNSSYTGTILVTNGVVQYNSGLALGAPQYPLFATNGGTLDLNGTYSGLKNIQISGTGYNGQGALISSANVALVNNNGVNGLTLLGDSTIAAVNRFDIYQNTLNGNGYKLTVLGPGANLLVDVGDPNLSDLHIVGGRLGFQGNVTMGDPSKTALVESGATLTFFSAVNPSSVNGGQTKILVLNTNATFDSGGSAGTSNVFNGPIFLAGTNLIGTRVSLHIFGGITDTNGPGGVLLGNDAVGASGGDLYFEGANSYTGPTFITNRTLFVSASSSLGNSSLIMPTAPGTLDVTSLSTLQLGAGQTLAGNGTVTGSSIVLASGSKLQPGLGGSNTTALTVNGALTLQAGSSNIVAVNKAATVSNSKVIGATSVAIAGTLILNVSGNPLVGGDAIPLFSAGSYSGGYSAIFPTTPGNNLVWNTSTLATDGTLRVASLTNPQPTNIVVSASGGQMGFSWPADHTGWTLQVQTNTVLGSNWFDVTGSSSTNKVFVPIDPAAKVIFYRMILRQ